MKVLIGCEESQSVCIAFRNAGHEAYSNDLVPCSGGYPEWHLQTDIVKAIISQKWDLIVLHPDCTYLAVSGNAHYGIGMQGQEKRKKAIDWTVTLWNLAIANCDKVALENPVSVIFKHLNDGKLQYIQPYLFGHPESKKTGLYLFGLPPLLPTEILNTPDCGYWTNQTPSGQNKLGPSPNRKRIRSRTYLGIAKAMANQWTTNIR
jgi:hypothetical protein